LKILIVCSTLDLKYRLGCTPSWWQLFKALYEKGNEVIAVPFLGDPIESLWWRTYPNPCSNESKIYNYILEINKKYKFSSGNIKKKGLGISNVAENYVRGKWLNHLFSIFSKEKDVDLLLFINVPLNFIRGIPEKIHCLYSIPIAYYDGDMPTILPKYAVDRGFKFNYYVNADLSEFDGFFTNSKGVIPDLEEMGAKNIHPLYYAVDPDLFNPVIVNKDRDISFFGYGAAFREEWMEKMISKPSNDLKNLKFSVAGGGFSKDLGNAEYTGDLSLSDYRIFCCKSKICLNITRWSHTVVYASSTARPFELAAFGACIVSQPYSGIGEWFEDGKELVIVDEKDNISSVYQELLDSETERERIGQNARARILKDHTYKKRAEEFLSVFK
jgi:hypothetical protein